MMRFLIKWIIWFWSAKSRWKYKAVATRGLRIDQARKHLLGGRTRSVRGRAHASEILRSREQFDD
jgi:hypothetical protein